MGNDENMTDDQAEEQERMLRQHGQGITEEDDRKAQTGEGLREKAESDKS